MRTAVVIEDPLGEFLLGEVVERNQVNVLRARGAALLPVDESLMRAGALAGFSFRSFARGVQFGDSPKHGCQTVLYVTPAAPLIYWCAKVVDDEQGDDTRANLRLTTDTSQRGVISGGLAAEGGVSRLPAKAWGQHPNGGSLVSGCARFTASVEGFLGLSLYGSTRGCSVAWLAVTQVSAP